MKLQRLAGYGPPAAFVSAAALFVFLFFEQFGSAIGQSSSAVYVLVVIVFVLALWLWIAGLNVVVFDLEWMEHPATSNAWFQVARWSTLVALAVPPLLLVVGLTNASQFFPILYCVTFLAVGSSLLIHNVDARRAGILRGPLPWLGAFLGIGYLIGGIGFGLLYFTTSLVIVTWNTLQLGHLLYLIWAIWMGIHLTRSRAVTPASAQAH